MLGSATGLFLALSNAKFQGKISRIKFSREKSGDTLEKVWGNLGESLGNKLEGLPLCPPFSGRHALFSNYTLM
jgi:hypothetical protein